MAITEYEQALVFAAKNGNEKCFEELYKLYYNKVYALAQATLKNNADAEDVLQQTFIQAWKNLSTLEDNSAFNTWIQRITLNQCYSLMRKNKPEISIDEENDEHGIFELESDLMLPEVYAQKEDLRVRLGNIITGLSEVQRQTIQLFYFDELSVEEIASVMDCSIGTVKSRLFLARKAIRTEVEETERKTGTKFYGIAGIPVLAFGKLFSSQAKAASIQVSSAVTSYSKIATEIFGTAKNIIIESAQEVANGIGKVTTQATEKTIPQSVTKTAQRQATEVAKDTIRKATATVAKGIGSRIVAAVLSAGILCGSVFGSFSSVSAAKVTLPENNNETKYYAAYSAYAELLNEKKEYIDSYMWQKGATAKNDYNDSNEPKPVVFADVYGDGTPELIYMSADETEYCSNLHIMSYQNGSIAELFSQNFDHQIGGVCNYYLYQRNSDKTLYAYYGFYCDYSTNEYFCFAEKNGKLIKKDNIKYDSRPNYEVSTNGNLQYIDTYYLDEAEISEKQYENTQSKMTDAIDTILMSTKEIPDNAELFIENNGCPAMTCDEAILYLKSKFENTFSLQESEIPDSLTRFLNQFRFGHWKFDYDSENVPTNSDSNLIFQIMTNGSCCDSWLYPGQNAVIHENEKDPRNLYASYSEYNLEKAKWIAKNIFNVSDTDIENLIEYGIRDNLFYVIDDIAYLDYGGVGGIGYAFRYNSAVFSDSVFKISFDTSLDTNANGVLNESEKESYQLTVGYKLIDGNTYWSLYNISPTTDSVADDTTVNVSDNVFSILSDSAFVFSSGHGGWSTVVNIDSAGNFVGEFHDSNMGDTSAEYPYGIYMECKFMGEFSELKKVDDYTYSMSLKSLEIIEPKTDYIEDGVKHVAATPYGIENGKTFMLYLPGKSTDDLPQEYISWVQQEWNNKIPSNLPFYGLYNVEERNGFFSGNKEDLSISVAVPDKKQDTSSISNEVQTLNINFFNDKNIDLQWGWDLFNKNASEYDHNLAMAGLILSQAAESGKNEIKNRYKTLGFENTRTLFYTEPGNINYPGVTFASKKVTLNSKDTIIVSIAVRGTSSNSDILTDIGSVTDGFRTSEMNLKAELRKYLQSINDSDWYGCKTTDNDIDVVFFITGHSLGGAVAELLASSSEAYSSRDKIFGYTFASPNVDIRNDNANEYSNIHNIINSNDLVPTVPWGYSKYGHCWYYNSGDKSVEAYYDKVYSENDKKNIGVILNHICPTYMACMLNGLPSNMGDGAKTTYSLSSIHCPVDIQVLDAEGKLAAWTVGDKAYYSDGANMLILVNDGAKYVYVPNGVEYNIVFVGTDTGTMSYSQQIISNDEIVSEKSFENVSLEAGKMLYAGVNTDDASSQQLKVIDASGHIEKEVAETGKETTPFLSLSIIGWMFLCLDIISAISLLISIILIIKNRRTGKSNT